MAGVEEVGCANAVLLGAADGLRHGETSRDLAEAFARVHVEHRAVVEDDLRLRLRVDVAAADLFQVLAHAHDAVRRMAGHLAEDERVGDQLRGVLRRVCSGEKLRHETSQFRLAKSGHIRILPGVSKGTIDREKPPAW